MSIDYFEIGKAAAEMSIDAHGKRVAVQTAYDFIALQINDGEMEAQAWGGQALPVWLVEHSDQLAFVRGYFDGDESMPQCGICSVPNPKPDCRTRGGLLIGRCCLKLFPEVWTVWLWHVTELRWQAVGEAYHEDGKLTDLLAAQSLPWVLTDDDGVPQYWRKEINIHSFIGRMEAIAGT